MPAILAYGLGIVTGFFIFALVLGALYLVGVTTTREDEDTRQPSLSSLRDASLQ